MHRLLRAFGALTIVLGLLVPIAPPVEAAEPHRPLPGYRPTFVTQREAGPWKDCLWASAAMLLDKWTVGEVRLSKDRLRALSGDRHGGSNLADLRRAFDRIRMPVRTSPDGGDVITWNQLRARLAKGGGAVVQGDYGRLPRYYGRWDPKLWRKTGSDDDHAMYLDRYDRRRDRFWLMDPLAPAGWEGEWIPARYIRAFTWRAASGGLYAVMTPRAERAPFDGVELGEPYASAIEGGLRVTWPTTATPKGWTAPRVDLVVKSRRSTDALVPPGPMVTSVGLDPTADGAKVTSSLDHADHLMTAAVPAPTKPGVYRITVGVRERRFGRTVVVSDQITLYVPGERRAQIGAIATGAASPAGTLQVRIAVTNAGSTDWTDASPSSAVPRTTNIVRDTRFVAHWIPIDVDDDGVEISPIRLDKLPLAAGASARMTLAIPTPAIPGRWALLLDITDDVDGSFAAAGSRPGGLIVDLVRRPTLPVD